MRLIPLAFFCISILYLQCRQSPNVLSATILEDSLLTKIPSGSGVVYSQDTLIIISDDANGYFELDINEHQSFFVPYRDQDTLIRIDKPVKPDMEAADWGKWNDEECLLAFGSGSVFMIRDSLFVLYQDDNLVQQFSLTHFYEKIRQQGNIKTEDFNIEALAVDKNNIACLFNRGTNQLIRFSINALYRHLVQNKELPKMIIDQFELPVVDSFEAGISGAAMLDKNRMLITASVEQTTNWYDDGKVAGSYIGMIDLGKDKPEMSQIISLVDKAGNTLPYKVESIIPVGKKTNSRAQVYLLCDNDDGSSRLIKIQLSGLKK